MARFQEIITDDFLRPIPNVAVDVLTAAGTLADLVDDEGDPLPNPLSTDEYGQLIFNAPDAVYTLQYRFGGALRRIDNRIVGDPPEYRGATGLASNTFDDLAEFRAAPTSQFKSATLVKLGALNGPFEFEEENAPYTELLPNVIKADDTPLSTGAWVRQGADKVAFDQTADAATGSVAHRLRETPSPQDAAFGVIGDGTTDDTAAWQAWINYCRTNNLVPRVRKFIKSRITDTITIPPPQVAVGIGANVTVAFDLGNVVFMYAGPRDRVVVDVGTAPNPAAPGTNAYIESRMVLPSVVVVAGSITWPATTPQGADTAIRIRRAFRCDITYGYVVGFSKGIELVGVTYARHHLQHVVDCKFALILTSEGTNIDDSFSNENAFFGGRLGHTSNSNGKGAAAMVVFTWDKVASYRGQNCNRFYGTCFESGGASSGASRIPIWFDGAGLHNVFREVRNEGNFGVLALCDGAGGGQHASANEFNMLYGESNGLQLAIQQVGGASGNIVTGPRSHQSHWHSGDMGKLVYSNGDAKAAIRGREFFFGISGTFAANTPSRVDPVGAGTSILSSRRSIVLEAGGFSRVGVAIDASVIKDFFCAYSTTDGSTGRPNFAALDASGNLLSGTATETATSPFGGATFANEMYVKANSTIAASSTLSAGAGGYQPAADLQSARGVFVTVRPEVKTLLFMVGGGSARVGVEAMSVTSYGFGDKVGSAYPVLDGIASLRVFNPLDDGSEQMAAIANPATSGVHGYYRRGDRVGNAVAATGAPSGWVCTTTGWLARAWAISTAYQVKGMTVTNDSGKIYELLTAGTSAGSGGPTGTGASITDGTCVWRYIGVKAVFAAEANLA